MQTGDISVFKLSASGINKLGTVEPMLNNPNKERFFAPIADLLLMLIEGKPFLYVFEAKGRVVAWEVQAI